MKPTNQTFKFSLKNTKILALLAVLSALAAAGRILFAPLPNIQPVTALVVMLTLLCGIRFGLLFATLTMVVSNFVLGLGIWTIGQVLGYALIALLTGLLLCPYRQKVPLWGIALFCGLMGYVYGLAQALFIAPIYGFSYFWVYYLAGLSFDTLHAIGNVAFYLVLAPIFFPLLTRLLQKYTC
ncbi:ECF transporter S component [Listeria kieliensis]|uniref:Metal ABC transporter permease n=1 Tax=Listeria kieliensis TaxID=1621700 RepID=A0A3D8TUU2_9LIST|nr:ECF transporter S component [Listeria kieliensis]RDX02559.1 metal ABC transporter permease [Listeria kieliensis]